MRAAFMLSWNSGGWTLARAIGGRIELREILAESGDGPDQQIEKVTEALREFGYRQEGICLAPPSEKILTAAIDYGNLPRNNRRTAMLYRLEEHLPLEAERLTADFLLPIGGKALAVAVETEYFRTLVESLECVGVETACICPAALLALWQFLAECSGDCNYAVLTQGSSRELFRITAGQPLAWYSAKDPSQLRRHLKADILSVPLERSCPRICLLGETKATTLELCADGSHVEIVATCEVTPMEMAARAARELLAGRRAGWVDLRRDKLAPIDPWRRLGGLLRSAICLAVALPVLLTGMLLWRAGRYEAAARRHEEAQATIHRRLFPSVAVPINVRSRIESELTRLRAISGEGFALPRRPSALETLRQTMAALPKHIRLRITDIRIDGARIFMNGQVRAHSDAEIIARALSAKGIVIEPPRTESLARGGVSFTLSGRLAAPESSHGKGDRL